MVKDRTHAHAISESMLIRRAVGGDAQAANSVLQYLSSTNPNLRQIMLDALHDNSEPRLWQCLLSCLAVQRWPNAGPETHPDCDRRIDPLASERIDLAIACAFVVDKDREEVQSKDGVLEAALEDPDWPVRRAAAYLLGLRGRPAALPVLEQAITRREHPPAGPHDDTWALRALQALATIKDPRAGFVGVKALALGDARLHHEAWRTLSEMGDLAEPALAAALEHPNSHIRWHAARGLGQLGDARAAHALAEGLRDPNESVRWASARTLAQLDALAVPAVLDVIVDHPLDEQFRQAAFHALHAMPAAHVQAYLQPLLEALKGTTARIDARLVAQRLRSEWKLPA